MKFIQIGKTSEGILIDSRCDKQTTSSLSRSAAATFTQNPNPNPNPNAIATGQLARRLADPAQASTQSLTSGDWGDGHGMFKSSILIIESESIVTFPNSNSNSNNSNPNQMLQNHIWRIDPTGQFWNCHAARVGRGSGLAERLLLKLVVFWKL